MTDGFRVAHELLGEIWRGLGGDEAWLDRVTFETEGALRSPFAVTDLASAVFAAAGCAVGELLATADAAPARVSVDRRVASGWFHLPDPTRLVGRPPTASPGHAWLTEFPTADDRWLRVQLAFATPRDRLFKALGTSDIEEIAALVGERDGDEIEQSLVDARVPAAVNRSVDDWIQHPAGRAVHAEPIADVTVGDAVVSNDWAPTSGRPLAGIRVLDLTRVAAGPTGTRFLAACGAEVLRLDPPGSDEAAGHYGRGHEYGMGKRWAYLDLRTSEGKERFLELLSEADVFAQSYRPGAIDAIVSREERFAVKPDLVEVELSAYGWTGPWRMRRGFDTLVQWSMGFANATQSWALEDPEHRVPITAIGRSVDASRPRHMPVEALDLATAYQVAAAALRGLTRRVQTGRGSTTRVSLARTGFLLLDKGFQPDAPVIQLPIDGPWQERIFIGPLGPVHRLEFPLTIEQNPLFWDRPMEPAGASSPVWATPLPPLPQP